MTILGTKFNYGNYVDARTSVVKIASFLVGS